MGGEMRGGRGLFRRGLVACAAVALVGVVATLGIDWLRSPSGAVTGHPVIAVVGDFGVDDANEAAVASMIRGWNPDDVVTTGDNYYATSGGIGTGKYDIAVGKYYCMFLKDAAAGSNCGGNDATVNRFFPVTGNHDFDDAGLAVYQSYFSLPGVGITSSSTSGSELYYDFTLGSIQFFVIDSTSALASAASMQAQQTWLHTALAASTTRWQIVVFHHAPYSSSTGNGPTPQMQWPFATWGADLVLSGHDHVYERIQRDGITYVINGLGGAGSYKFGTPTTGSVVRYNATYGAMTISADDASLSARMIATNGNVVDDFTLGTPTTTTTAANSTTTSATFTTTTTSPTTTTTPASTTTTGPASTTTTVTTSTTPLPPAPFAKINPVNGGKNVRTASLKWGNAARAQTYEYCVDTVNNGICDTGWISAGTNTATTVASTSSTTYWWQVRARNNVGTTEANGGSWWTFTTR
jgi:hypothetical protein